MGPLRGFTERPFRDAFSAFFSDVDVVLAPFIPLVTVDYINPSRLRDILPNDERIPLIPQVIGNSASQIIQMAEVLKSYGYEEINWNLGCPMPKITRKNRGSGLLRYPQEIHSLLSRIFKNLDMRFSVKTRIGFEDTSLFNELADVFSQFPLSSLTVHTRTGSQMYSGTADKEFLLPYLEKFRGTELIYNGDIFSIEDFETLKKLMPAVSSWMIGRGLIRNPFLGEEIKAGEKIYNKERFLAFHNRLNENVERTSTSEKTHLNRMKGYWTQFRFMFNDPDNIKNNILRAQSLNAFLKAAETMINESGISKL
jgi:tRNA-dihydrouridine synthase